jgi:hypothetical protein
MELKKLQSRYKDLQIDYDQQKSQLIEALLSKDKLQQSITENRTRDESKADESVETKQMKDSLDKASSELKASQEVSPTMAFEPFSEVSTTKASIEKVICASEELAREQALLGYTPAIKISLRPEEVPLPLSPTLLSDDGQAVLSSRHVLRLESLFSSIGDGGTIKRNPSAGISRPKSNSSWKFWKKPRSPSVNSVSFQLNSLPPHFSGSSLSLSQKALADYTRKLTDDIAATPKAG